MGDTERPGGSSARPTIAVDGQDSSSLTEGIVALRIDEAADGLLSCEATFGHGGTADGNPAGLPLDRATVDFGKDLQVSKDSGALFRGRISAIGGGFPEHGMPTLAVHAHGLYQDLRMTRRTRTFENVSDANMMELIASDHGLTPDVDVEGPTVRVLAQLNQSDLAFLRHRARAIDAELWLDGSTLHVRSHVNRDGPKVTLGYGHQLREFAVTADLAGQRSSLKVTGWDVSGKEAIAVNVDESVVGSELNGGTSGPSLLRASLGERRESVVHTVPLTIREAEARAQALFKRMARRFVVGHGVAETTVDLRVGAKVNVEGLGELFSGAYYVSEVTHRFDTQEGFRTEFTAERASLGGSS